MAFLVEQVNTDGTIVCDYDQTLSVRALYERIATYFPGIYRDEDGIICGVYQGRKYSIRAKNVSYLGNPHPVFKKRIQGRPGVHPTYFLWMFLILCRSILCRRF